MQEENIVPENIVSCILSSNLILYVSRSILLIFNRNMEAMHLSSWYDLMILLLERLKINLIAV